MVLMHTPKPEIGKAMPDFALPGTDGKTYSSDSFDQEEILIIIFTCNHCPYAKFAKPKLEALYEHFKNQPVRFVAINPNDEKEYPEDSFEKMKEAKYNYPFPYLRDESQEIAKQFGAVCTPDIFVYDKERRLAYRGQIDDDRPGMAAVAANVVLDKDITPGKQKIGDLAQTITNLLADELPSHNQKPSTGCSIKWKE